MCFCNAVYVGISLGFGMTVSPLHVKETEAFCTNGYYVRLFRTVTLSALLHMLLLSSVFVLSFSFYIYLPVNSKCAYIYIIIYVYSYDEGNPGHDKNPILYL